MSNTKQKVSIQSGYILVERLPGYQVVWSEEPAKLRIISAICKRMGFHKVLVRGPRTKVSLSKLDIFDLGQEIARLNLQVAIVEAHDASKESERFLENVATNRGGPTRFFDNEQEAKDWLGVPHPPA